MVIIWSVQYLIFETIILKYLWSCFASRLKLFINFVRASKIYRGGDRWCLKQKESMHSIIKIINDGKYIFMRKLMRTDNFYWSRPHIPAATLGTKPSSPGSGLTTQHTGTEQIIKKTKSDQEWIVTGISNHDLIVTMRNIFHHLIYLICPSHISGLVWQHWHWNSSLCHP